MTPSDDLGFIADETDDLGFQPDESLPKDVTMSAIGVAAQTALAPINLAQNLSEDPEALYKKTGPYLPMAGSVIGSAFAPGLGTAIGAGAGEMLRQATGIAFDDPNAPRTARKAGLNAALQTGAAGFNEVKALGKGVMPFAFNSPARQAMVARTPALQRGIEWSGQKLAPVGKAIKTGVSKVQQAFTGAPARNAMQIMDKPGTLVSTIGQVGKTGKALEGAEAALANKLPAELEAAITTNKGGAADEIVTNLMAKSRTAPEAITAEEAIAGVKAIDRSIPAPTRSNAQVLQKYFDLRSKLADIISKAEPKYAAAKTAYSEAKGASAFRNIFPRTKTGEVSTVKTVLPMLLDWKRISAFPVTSPVVWGTAMASGSALAKGIGGIASSPTARQALISQYIAKKYGGADESR